MFRRTKRSFSLALFLLTLLSILNPASASAVYGEIDNTYGGNGSGYNFLDITDSSINFPIEKSRITSSAIDSQGRLVVAGYTLYDDTDRQAFAIARFNPNGTLDTTFGPNNQGFVSLYRSTRDYFYAVAVQSDDKIIAAGRTRVGSYFNWVVVRVTASGVLDTTFGSGGTGYEMTSAGLRSTATAIAISPNNEIYVAGTTTLDPWISPQVLPTVAKYDANGVLIPSYGSYGTGIETITVGDFSPNINGLTLSSSGEAIIVGGVDDNVFMKVFISRFSANGTPDLAFGGNNTGFDTTTVASSMTFFNAATIQSDGKIVAAGSKDSGQLGVLARYNSDGTLDGSFGASNNGFVDLQVQDEIAITSVRVDTSGHIVTGGQSRLGAGSTSFVVARYTATGSLDTSFGNQSGYFLANLSTRDVVNTVQVTSTGGVIFAGHSVQQNSNADSFVVGRLQAAPVVAGPAPAISVPDPIQQSVILSIDSITPTTETPAAIVIEGNFPEPIVNIIVNQEPLAPQRWEQSPTQVVITRVDSGPQIVQIYNGAVPLLPEQKIVIPAIAPATPTAVVLPPLPLPEPESVIVGQPLDTAKVVSAAPLNIYFTMASSTLGDVSKKRISAWFFEFGSGLKSLQITGFAQPTPKGAALDPALSQRRANSVKKYLKELGFQGSITTRGAGRTTANVATSRYVEVIGTATR